MTLTELEQDATFKALPYEDQQSARVAWMYKENRDQLNQMSPQQRLTVIKALRGRGPVYDDPSIGLALEGLGQRIMGKDQDAWRQGAAILNYHTAKTNSMIVGLFDEILVAPLLKEGFRPSTIDAGDISHLRPADERKAVSYLNSVMSTWEEEYRGFRMWNTLLGLGVNIAETLAMYAVGVGTLKNPKLLGRLGTLAKNAVTNIGKTGAVTNFANLAGEIGVAAGGGILGVGREFTLDWLQGEAIMNEGFVGIMERGARYFKDYFIWDAVANVAFGIVLPSAALVGRAAINRGMGKIEERNIAAALEVFENVSKGTEMSQETLRALPRKIRRNIETLQGIAKTINNVGNADEYGIFQVLAAAKGYGVGVVEGSTDFLVYSLNPKRSLEKTFKTFNDLQEFVVQDLYKIRNRILTASNAGAFVGREEMVGRGVTRSSFPASELNADILARIGMPQGGKWTRQGVEDFARGVALMAEVPSGTARKFTVLEKEGQLILSFGKNELLEFSVDAMKPGALKGTFEGIIGAVKKTLGASNLSDDEIRLGTKFFDAVKALEANPESVGLKGAVTKARNAIRHAGYNFEELVKAEGIRRPISRISAPVLAEDVVTRGMKRGLLTSDWLKGVWDEAFGGSPFPEGAQFEDVLEAVLKTTNDEGLLKKIIYRAHGYVSRPIKATGEVVLESGGKEMYRGKSLAEIVSKHPELLDELPTWMGPRMAVVVKSGQSPRVGVTWTSNRVAVGSYQGILDVVDMFAAPHKGGYTVPGVRGKHGTIRTTSFRKGYIVEMPSLKYTETFATLEEAKSFINEGLGSWKNIRSIASNKGFWLTTYDGAFVLWNGEKSFLARNADELTKILESVPSPVPEKVPNLTGEGYDAIVEGVTRPDINFLGKRPGFVPKKEGLTPLGFGGFLMDQVRPLQAMLERYGKRTGDMRPLEYIAEIEARGAAFRAGVYQVQNAIFGLFKKGGRTLTSNERIPLLKYLEQTTDSGREAIRTQFNLDADDLKIVDVMREFFGRGPEEGLALRFNVPFQDFVTNYAPRIRKMILSGDEALKNIPDNQPLRFLDELMGGSAPPQMREFFRRQRVSSIKNLAFEEDPALLMAKYYLTGSKAELFEGTWGQMDNLIKELQGTAPEIAARLATYEKAYFGTPTSAGMHQLRIASQRMYQKMGLDVGTARDMSEMVMSWGYFSLMGFKPWLPVRNSMQVWSTVAPRIGDEWVNTAIRELAGDKVGEIYNRLMGSGVINEFLPLAGADELAGAAATFLNKMQHTGLRFYKSSDSLTRAIAYRAFELRFDDALKGVKKGQIKTFEEFISNSPLGIMDKATQARAWDAISAGEWDTARHIGAFAFVDETLFPYRKGLSGSLFSAGTFGKIFGMMGYYPTFYTENVVRGLSRGSAADKVYFATTFTANTVLLYEMFKELFGVEEVSFLPWAPMAFDGGPVWHLVQTAMTMTKSDYAGRQARAEGLGLSIGKDGKVTFDPRESKISRYFLPAEIFAIRDAIDFVNAGDWHGAAVRVMGARPTEDWEFPLELGF